MTKLIKNELKKIFHKKSFYIVTILLIAYTFLTNFVYKNMNEYYYDSSSDSVNIAELKAQNATLDLNNSSDLSTYVNNLNQIELAELSEKYSSSNQIHLISRYLYNVISEANHAKYYKYENAAELEKLKSEAIEKVKNEDFAYFVSQDIASLKEQQFTDSKEKQLNDYYIALKEYRINNNVPFDNGYLDQALNSAESSLSYYLDLANKENRTKAEEDEYQDYKELMAINEYILKEKKDINSNDNLKSVLSNFHLEFAMFILIYIVMISGSIVSEEFNKGTIKYLLTKPYKRSTILTSKLLTLLIIIPIIIIMMYLIEVIVGGIMLGFDSLNIPVVIYNSTENVLVVQNVFAYSFKALLSVMPMYLVLMVLCFMLSTITGSTSASITITFMFYLASSVIAQLAAQYSIKILKAFVSVHWDFSYLVEFTKNPYGISTITSLLVVAGYIIVMLCLAYVYFSKKDVKNI